MPENDKIFTLEEYSQMGGNANTVQNDAYISNDIAQKTSRADYLNSPNFKVNYDSRLGGHELANPEYWDNEMKAVDQSTVDKLGNGLAKFAGKTALYTVGNLSAFVYGIPKAIADGKLSSFYDNEFMHLLDSGEEMLDENFKNYISREESNYGNLRALGTTNFWANDVLGGFAFVTSAVLSGALTGGAMSAMGLASAGMRATSTARLLANANKVVKGLGKTSRVSDLAMKGIKTANTISGATGKAVNYGVKAVTGTYYEAGVEARHFVNEASEDFLAVYAKNNDGAQPSPEELAIEMDKIHNTANALFAGNAALVGFTNIITLPKTFGLGFKSLPVNRSKSLLGIKTPSNPFSAKNITREGALTEWELAYNGWSKARKVGYGVRQAVKTPLTEGLVEEGGQSLMSNAALKFAASQYSSEGVDSSYTMWDSMTDAFSETYGDVNNTAFWKEVMIGSLIGGMGAPSLNFKNGLAGAWQGSTLSEFRESRKDIEEAGKYVDFLNANKTNPAVIAAIKLNNSIFETNKEIDAAVENNDMLRAKNAENAQLFALISNRYDLGRTESIEEDFTATVREMNAEEFAETFGYENMTNEELDARKEKVTTQLADKVASVKESIKQAKRITGGRDLISKDEDGKVDAQLANEELSLALAYSIESVKNLDLREDEIVKEFAEKLNVNDRELKEALNFNNKIAFTKNWLTTYKDEAKKLKDLEEKTKKEIETLTNAELLAETEASRKSTQQRIKIKQAKVKEQDKKVKGLMAEEVAKRKGDTSKIPGYNYDIDDFTSKVESLIEHQENLSKIYAKNPELKVEDTPKLNDLVGIAKQREAFVQEIQSLMSSEGARRFNDSLQEIKEHSFRITKKDLIERYKKDLLQMALNESSESQLAIDTLNEQEVIMNEEVEEIPPPTSNNPVYNGHVNTFKALMDASNESSNSKESLNKNAKKLKQLKEIISKSAEDKENSDDIKDAYKKLLAAIEERINTLEQVIDFISNTELGESENILHSPHSLIRVIIDDDRIDEVNERIRKADEDTLNSKLSIKRIPYKEASDTPVSPVTATSKQEIEGPIKIMKGDGKKHGYQLYFGDFLIGGLTHPNKFLYNGVTLDMSNDEQVTALVGSSKEAHSRLREYHKKAIELFNMVDAGTATSGTIAKILRVGYALPGYEGSPIVGVRKAVGEYFRSNPEFKVTVGKKEGFLIAGNNGKLYLYQEDGTITSVTDDLDAKQYFRKALKKAPGMEGMKHTFKLLVPAEDGEVVTLGLDYPPSTVADEDLNSELLGYYDELENKTFDELEEEHSENKAVYRRSDLFITIKSLGKKRSPRLSATISVQRRRIKDKDTGAVSFSSPSVTVVLEQDSTDGNKKYFNGVAKKVDGELVVSFKNKGVETIVPLTKDALIKKLGQSLYGFVKTPIAKDKTSLWEDVKDDSGKPGDATIEFKDIKNRILTDNLGEMELASLPTNMSKQDRVKVKPSVTLFSDILKKEKALRDHKEPAKTNEPNPAKVAVGTSVIAIGNIAAGGTAIITGMDPFSGKPTYQSPTSIRVNVREAADRNMNLFTIYPESISDKVLDFGGIEIGQKMEAPNRPVLIIPATEGVPEKMYDVADTGEIEGIYAGLLKPKAKKKAETAPEAEATSAPVTEANTAATEPAIPKSEEPEETGDMPDMDGESSMDLGTLDDAEEGTEGTEGNKDDNDDIMFSSSRYPSSEGVKFSKAMQILSKLLPLKTENNPNGLISVKDLKALKKRLHSNGTTFGAFYDSVIYLDSKDTTKGVIYHEAFHAVFRALLSENERVSILKEASLQYGKPTAEDIHTLKMSHPSYLLLDNSKLTDLWLEEKLADSFSEYATKTAKVQDKSKGAIRRFFDKIVEWIKAFKASNRQKLTALFDDILSGQYISSTKLHENNGSIAFMMLNTPKRIVAEKDKKIAIPPREKLSNKESEILIARIAKAVAGNLQEKELSNYNMSDITKGIENVKEYYSNANWESEYQYLVKNSPNGGAAKRMANKLQDLRGALNHKANGNKLYTEVIKILGAIDPEITYEVDTEDSTERLYDKHVGEDTGFKTLSSRIKALFLTTTVSFDEFNIGISEESLQDDKYQVPLNAYATYYNVTKGLVDTSIEDMIPKLEYLSKYDDNVRAFKDNLLELIAKDLGKSADVARIMDVAHLRKSSLFGAFVSNFRRTRLDIKDILYDSNKGIFKIVSANRKDAAKTQFDSWANTFSKVSFLDYPAIAKRITNELEPVYFPESSKSKDISTFINNLDNKADFVKRFLQDNLGMTLSIPYIKWSMLNDNIETLVEYETTLLEKAQEGEITPEDLALVTELIEERELFASSGLNSLNHAIKSTKNNEVTRFLFGLLPGDSVLTRKGQLGNPYSYKGALKVQAGLTESRQAEEGTVTRITNIAASNAVMDPTVRPTSYQNIEGKNIWDVVYPSFYTDMFALFKTSSFKDYFNNVSNNTWKDLRAILANNNVSYPDHFLELYHDSLANNPLLIGANIEEMFGPGSLLSSIGGMREVSLREDGQIDQSSEFKKGKTWKKSDVKSKILLGLSYFSNESSKDSGEYAYYNFNVNEGKSSTFLAKLKKEKFVNGNESLTGLAKLKLNTLLIQELNRINREHSNIKKVKAGKIDKYEGYNYSKDPKTGEESFSPDENSDLRAFDLQGFKFIKDINPDVYKDLIVLAKASKLTVEDISDKMEGVFDDYFDSIQEQFVDILASSSVRAIIITKNGFKNNSLPKEFLKEESTDINMVALKNFIMNDFIQTTSFNNLLSADMAFQSENFTDFVKRNAGSIAYGPSLGEGQTNISVVNSSFADDRVSEGVDIADGQSYATEGWVQNVYINGLGKSFNLRINEIWKKKRKGYDLSTRELEILKAHKVMDQSKKLVLVDQIVYGKTSTATLERASISYVDPKNRADLDTYYDELFLAEENKDAKGIAEAYVKIHATWDPLPHRKRLHELLTKMENSSIDMVLFDSAMKKSKPNVVDINQEGYKLGKFTVNNQFMREQVVTDGFKNSIVHGVQLMQLVWSEQNPETIVTVNGKEHKIGILQEWYKKQLSDRIKLGQISLENDLFIKSPDGSKILRPNYKKISEVIKSTLETANPNPYLMELFSTDIRGNFEYNVNFPGATSKFYQMFLSFASDGVLKHKTKGAKYTLQSDFGFEVLRNSAGDVIRTDTYKSNPEHYKGSGFKPSPLNYDESTGIAEAIISSNVAKLYNLEVGDPIPDYVAKQLGFRIPTQDKHSMIKLKVVDILPATTLNTIIVHPKVIEFSGADFDIDALYARMYEVYKGTKFGGYLQTGSLEDGVNEILNSKKFKAKFSDFMAKTNLEDKMDMSKDLASGLSFEELEDKYSSNKKNKIKEALEHFFMMEKLSKDPETLKKINPELYLQINKNIKSFANSDILKIEALTIEEINNSLLDLEYEFINNDGNKEIATTPSSFKIFKEAIAEWEKLGIGTKTKNVGYHDIVSKFNAIRANDAGNAGIGPIAMFNVAVQNLITNNTKLVQALDKDGKPIPFDIIGKSAFSSFTHKHGDVVDRVNDSNSTILSGMTDNPKHLFSILFNLNQNTVNIAGVMNGLGVSSSVVLNLFKQKSFEYFSNLLERQDGAFTSRTDVNWIVDKIKDSSKLMGAFMEDNGYEDIKLSDVKDSKIELTKENLLLALQDKLSEIDYLKIQFLTLENTIKAKQIAQEGRAYAKVLTLIKGFKAAPGELDSLFDTLEGMGIKMKRVGKEVILESTKSENIIDWLDVVNSNPYNVQQLKTAFAIREHLGKFLISYSDWGQEMITGLFRNSKTELVAKKALTLAAITNLPSFLMFKTKGQKYSVSDVFNKELYSKFDELFERAKNPKDGELFNNAFLLSLTKDTKQDNGIWSLDLVTNTRSKLNADMSSDIMDSFYTLNEVDPEFTRDLVKYLIVKNGMQFKNNSFISSIDPRVLKSDSLITNFFSELDQIQEVFAEKDEAKLKKLYGISFNALKKEFISLSLLSREGKDLVRASNTESLEAKSKALKKAAVIKQDGKDKELYRAQMARSTTRTKTLAPNKSVNLAKTDPVYIHKGKSGLISRMVISAKVGFDFVKTKDPKAKNDEWTYLNSMIHAMSKISVLGKGSEKGKIKVGRNGKPLKGEDGKPMKAPTYGRLAFPPIILIYQTEIINNSKVPMPVYMKLTKVNSDVKKSIHDGAGVDPVIADSYSMVSGLEAVYEPIYFHANKLYSTIALDSETIADLNQSRKVYKQSNGTIVKIDPLQEQALGALNRAANAGLGVTQRLIDIVDSIGEVKNTPKNIIEEVSNPKTQEVDDFSEDAEDTSGLNDSGEVENSSEGPTDLGDEMPDLSDTESFDLGMLDVLESTKNEMEGNTTTPSENENEFGPLGLPSIEDKSKDECE